MFFYYYYYILQSVYMHVFNEKVKYESMCYYANTHFESTIFIYGLFLLRL
jgi:hypothetical protein